MNFSLDTLKPEEVRIRKNFDPEQRLFDVQGQIPAAQEAMCMDVSYELHAPEKVRTDIETKER